jgi:hypothetical protein
MRDEQGNLILPPKIDDLLAKRKSGRPRLPDEAKLMVPTMAHLYIRRKDHRALSLLRASEQIKTYSHTIRLLVNYYRRNRKERPLISEDYRE